MASEKEKKNTTRLPFLSFLPFSVPRAPAKGPTHTRRPYDHVQVVRLPEGGGRPGRLDAAAPAPAVRRREAALADGGEGARRRRVPLCPSLTPLPFSPCARDYPVTADEYELLEECGRGVSATVSENGERERAGEMGGGAAADRHRRRGGPPPPRPARPLSSTSHPSRSLCLHFPSTAPTGLARPVQAVRRDRRRQADGPGKRQLQPGARGRGREWDDERARGWPAKPPRQPRRRLPPLALPLSPTARPALPRHHHHHRRRSCGRRRPCASRPTPTSCPCTAPSCTAR